MKLKKTRQMSFDRLCSNPWAARWKAKRVAVEVREEDVVLCVMGVRDWQMILKLILRAPIEEMSMLKPMQLASTQPVGSGQE